MNRTQEMADRALTCIPGGSSLFSKRPALYHPTEWPAFATRASGVEVEDLDGRRFVDVSIHGIGSCLLGYADPEVDDAVMNAVRLGSMSSVNCPEEVMLAEHLVRLHPWADMVRAVRGGGEALAVAVRAARAFTGRERVAVNGYHGWHDWYLAANLSQPNALDESLMPNVDVSGVPQSLAGSTVAFRMNDVEAFDDMIERCGQSLAAVVVESARFEAPNAEYLAYVSRRAREVGAVVVFDEITSGFRFTNGGAHLLVGVEPDITIFGKALSNGYAMGAVLGRRPVMQKLATCFVSSTYWTERIGPSAALATLAKLKRESVATQIGVAGDRMASAWRNAATRRGLNINVVGVPQMLRFQFQQPDGKALMTLFTQEMLDRNFLATGAFYPTFAHTVDVMNHAVAAIDEAFGAVAQAVATGTVRDKIRGAISSPGLRGS